MTQYRLHWWPPADDVTQLTLDAPSIFHGAALALQRFMDVGCDLAAPGVHIDVTDSQGMNHTIVVEEVLEWLKHPAQAAFVEHEGLAGLLRVSTASN
jgi:hypothetical protein